MPANFMSGRGLFASSIRAVIERPADAAEVGAIAADEFCARIERLPNYARSGIERRPASSRAVAFVAETAWTTLSDAIELLGEAASAAAVRDAAHLVVAHVLRRRSRSSHAESIAAQSVLVAAFSKAGNAPPDAAIDAAVLAQLALALESLQPLATFAANAGNAAQLAVASPPLASLTVERSDVSGFGISVVVQPSDVFDPQRWIDGARRAADPERNDAIARFFDANIVRLAEGKPSALDLLDEAVFAAHGFRLLDVYAALLLVAESQPSMPDTFPRAAPLADLADAIAADGHAAQRAAAIEALTWPVSLDATWRPWTINHEPHRLAVRPLIPVHIDGEPAVMFSPLLGRAATAVWNKRLSVGNWPLRGFDREEEQGVRRPAKRLSEQIDHLFEHVLAERLEALGIEPADIELNIESIAQLTGRGSGPLLYGEIDLIAFDRRRRIVLLVEAKHPDFKLRAADVATTLRNMFLPSGGRPSVTAKLNSKLNSVQAVLPTILQMRGLASSNWAAIAAVVTPPDNPIVGWCGPTEVPVLAVDEFESWYLAYADSSRSQ